MVVAGAVLVVPACGDDRASEVVPVTGRTGTASTTAVDHSTTTGDAPTTTLAVTSTTVVGGSGGSGEAGRELAEGDPLRTEIETAYRNAVQAAESAAAIPTTESVELARWNSGPMLEKWLGNLEALQIQGRVVREPEPSRERLEFEHVRAAGRSAEIETCEVDDAVVVEVASGTVINDQVSTNRMRARLRFEGNWKLAEREILNGEGGPCFAG